VDTGKVKVLLEGDPFPVDLAKSQVSGCKAKRKVVKSKSKVPKSGANKRKDRKSMTETATKLPKAKPLRQRCQALGIEGWEDMGRKEMAKAIRKAERAAKGGTVSKKSKTSKGSKPAATKPKSSSTKPKATKAASKPAKKAAATKKAAPKKAASKPKVQKSDAKPGSNEALGLTFAKFDTPKALPAEGENPFRKSSNLHRVAKLLLKGGTRSVLAAQLAKQVELHPYHKGEVDLDDFDKRLLLGAQTMRDQFGYGIQRLGRGIEGKILVFRPGSAKDPRKKFKAKAKK
jgi:hypothetical protein